MGQHMAFQVLFLFEGLVTAGRSALESSSMALEVPVELILADELLIDTDRALEL